MKKYLPFLILGPISNALWAWWALPEINEQGTGYETLQWLCTQALVPVLFVGLLLFFRKKIVYWLLVIYSGFIILFGIGIFGWALMGAATPLSIYAVCFIFFIMGFGILYQALKDLNFGKTVRRYHDEDQ